MYYNSNKQANDYYHAYKKEMQAIEAYNKQGRIHKIIKIILISISFILLMITSIYLYQYFYPNVQLTEPQSLINPKKLTRVLSEENLPISPQVLQKRRNSKSILSLQATKVNTIEEELSITALPEDTTLNKKDIALILNIVMSQLDKKNETLIHQLNAVEKQPIETKDLNKSNHYNKVVVSLNSSENELTNLSNQLEQVISKSETPVVEKAYSIDIQKEIAVRTNEMRIIVVQEGDTLSKIAQKAYGNPMAYAKIFSANPEIIENPNQIFVGQKLRIPS